MVFSKQPVMYFLFLTDADDNFFGGFFYFNPRAILFSPTKKFSIHPRRMCNPSSGVFWLQTGRHFSFTPGRLVHNFYHGGAFFSFAPDIFSVTATRNCNSTCGGIFNSPQRGYF
jgi:hypothetical protein